jgi:hypothetical protein
MEEEVGRGERVRESRKLPQSEVPVVCSGHTQRA